MLKVLNLYAGIGGNRKLWQDVEVIAVENNPEIAKVYCDFFPQDKMIITDAHQYLLEHFQEYDFIWSSVPCFTHSRARFWGSGSGKMKPLYPDMRLYEEILFLKHFYKGLWIVENVKPYYNFLINPTKIIGRHSFWSNFYIYSKLFNEADINRGNIKEWQKLHGINLDNYSFKQRKDQILRNCVLPELGLHILNCALEKIGHKEGEQMEMRIYETNKI